MQGEPRDAVPL